MNTQEIVNYINDHPGALFGLAGDLLDLADGAPIRAGLVFGAIGMATDVWVADQKGGGITIKDLASFYLSSASGFVVGAATTAAAGPVAGLFAGFGASALTDEFLDGLPDLDTRYMDPIVTTTDYADGSRTVEYFSMGPYFPDGHLGLNPGYLLVDRAYVYGPNGVLERVEHWPTLVDNPEQVWADLQQLRDAQAVHLSQCFPSGTAVQIVDGGVKGIEELKVGDWVLAFDPTSDEGRGELVPKRVARIFENITDQWVRLSNGVVVTPGHHFLDAYGKFRSIHEILSTDGRIVLADGSLLEVSGEYLSYSSATESHFERHEGWVAPVVGSLAMSPIFKMGWKTYNFEVEDFHTYIAGGIRVHNASVFTATGKDISVGALFKSPTGDILEVTADGAIHNRDTGYTSPAGGFARVKYLYAPDSMTPAEQTEVAQAGGFSSWQTLGSGPAVRLASGKVVNAGTVFATGDGYQSVVNADGSVTNIDTGHTYGGGQVVQGSGYSQNSDGSHTNHSTGETLPPTNYVAAGTNQPLYQQTVSIYNPDTNQFEDRTVYRPAPSSGSSGSSSSSSGSGIYPPESLVSSGC